MAERLSAELTKRVVDAAMPGCCVWDGGTRGVSGFGLRVAPGGTKSFVFRYRDAGGDQHQVTLGRYPSLTVEQTRELAKVQAHNVARGNDPRKARKAAKSAPTVAVLAEHYLGAYAAFKPLRASTVRDARDVLRHVLPTIGKLRVAEVTTEDVRQACAGLRIKGEKAGTLEAKLRGEASAAASEAAMRALEAVRRAEGAGKRAGSLRLILKAREKEAARARVLLERAEARAKGGQAGVHQANRLRAVLSTMFGIAIEQGTRPDNPCAPVKKLTEDQRWRNLSEGEVGRLLDACDAYEGENGMEASARGGADAIRLLLFTGARLREVLRAEWPQFDLERGLWQKPSSHTKTKRQHRLELDGPALDLLREMRERAPHPRLLFPGSNRQRQAATPLIVKPRVDLKRPWERIVALAALEDVRLHDLRRTTASFMLSGGASLATVGKSLGHTQASTTARYAHLAETVQREELKKAGERMAGLRRGSGNVVPLVTGVKL